MANLRLFALVLIGLVMTSAFPACHGPNAYAGILGPDQKATEENESLKGAPAHLDLVYSADIWSIARGRTNHGLRYLDNLDLQLSLPAQKLGLQEGTFFIYGMYNNNQLFDEDLIGSLQGSSNIETSRVFRLEEAWYERDFWQGYASLKMGIIDLNSEFDAIDPAGLFLNPSHGIGVDYSQSGDNGPSIFPNTGLAARLAFDHGRGWASRFGIFDASPNDPDHPRRLQYKLNEGFLLTAEIEKNTAQDWRFVLGAWRYTKDFERILPLDNNTKTPSQGLYAFAHGPLTEKTSAWLRLGRADSRANRQAWYLGSGITIDAPFGDKFARGEDQLGLAIALTRTGRDARRAEIVAGSFFDRQESNFELSYRYPLNEHLALQPDIQYFINPGTLPGVKNVLILGLRLEISFGRDF